MPFIITLILLIIIVIIRLLPKKHHDIVVDMSYEEMISNVRSFAQSMRKPARFGAGISIKQSRQRLEKAYLSISNRVKASKELYEFERLIYENYHLIRKLLENSNYKGYTTLPHKNMNPRIITIAHFIVKGCSRRLNRDKLIAFVKAFNKYTPLHYSETSILKNALLYTLVKDLSMIAEKSTHYDRMKRLAERTNEINQDFYMSDSYLYYYTEKWGELKDISLMKKSDVNIDNVDNAFITALIDNCVAVTSIIDSIRDIDRVINDDVVVDVTTSHQQMLSNNSYQLMDIDSKKAYLSTVNKISDSLNVSERAVIDSAFELEEDTSLHFGEFLFGNTRRLRQLIKRGKDKSKYDILSNTSMLYITTVLFLSIISGIAYYLMSSGNTFYRLGMSVLIGLALIKPIEHLYSFIIKYEHRFMPKMGYENIPPNGETMVVISELLCDVNSVKKAFSHLKIVSENTLDNNVSYMLLADLNESKSECERNDDEIIMQISEEYSKLDKIKFNVLIRKRTKANGKYSGKERKRGAIMELCKYLIERESDQFIYQGNELRGPKFLVLLDADNELLPNAIKRAINSMLHPLNEKYDLLTFGCATNMHSIKTHYSKRYLYSCGIPDYGKSTDYIYDMSMNSIFCGKGILRLESFYDKLKDIFPENRILSHDIIEGAILKTGAIEDRVYEDAPSNIVSDIERKSRWIRGDFQLLPYIFKRKPISIKPIYRYTIFSNAINTLLPTIQLGLIIALLYTSNPLLLPFVLVSLLLSFVLDIIGVLRGFTSAIRTRYVLYALYNVFKSTLSRWLMLPFDAINGLYLFVLTIIRMTITHKKLLEWKTYSSTQGASKFEKYVKILTPSFIIMTLINILLNNNMFLLYTALFFAFSISMHLIGKEMKDVARLSDGCIDNLVNYAEDIYRFFDDYTRDKNNYLIPDNIQIYPYKGERFSTSPSNIGLSILAFISAFEIDIINENEIFQKIDKIITTIEKMPKWRGHLYNWYNTKSLDVLYPRFVSSVDSANFIACLIVANQFMLRHNNLSLSKRIDNIIYDTDFNALYDKSAYLYYIGYNETTGKFNGHYDLLASEARILSYLATAFYKNKMHWMKLSRECVALRGNTLVSWSGTAFEYLMPELFLDTPKYSLIGTSVKNMVDEQINSKVRGLWGISEGGYYRFDEQLNYEYKAFGLRELSLRSDYSRAVITPYSSFLALNYNPRAVYNNLKNIKNRSMYGQYGFYEALDMYSGERVVNSFMAHHLGMSIASIANYVKGNIIKDYFYSNSAMASVKLVLTEQRQRNKFTDVKDDSLIYERREKDNTESFAPKKALPKYNVLSNGIYSVVTDDYGQGYSLSNNIYLGKYRKDIDCGMFCYILDKENNNIASPTYSPIRDEIDNYSVTYSSNSSLYHNKDKEISMEIFVPPCFSGEVRKYSYQNIQDKGKEIRIALFLDLNLNTLDKDIAHPVFNDMFIETSYDKERNAIISKRKKIEGKGYIYSALIIKGMQDIRVDTDRMSFLGRGQRISNPRVLSSDYIYNGENIGDVLYPCYGVYADVPISPKSTLEFYTALVISEDNDKLLQEIDEANSLDFVKHAEMSSKVTSVNFYNKCIKNSNTDLRELCDYTMNRKLSNSQLKLLEKQYIRECLVKYEINPYCRYLIFEYKGEASDNSLRNVLGMLRYLSRADILINLVVMFHNSDDYYQNNKTHLEDMLQKEKVDYIKPIMINKDYISNEEFDNIYKVAFGIVGKLAYENHNISSIIRPKKLRAIPLKNRNILFNSGEGGFSEEGDYIVKPYFGKTTLLPYSNVVALKKGGFIVTADGGGYTFGINSRENKLTEWYNDPVNDYCSEYLYLSTNKGYIRLNSVSNGMGVTHSKGLSTFSGRVNNLELKVSEYMILDGQVKVYDVNIYNDKNTQEVDIILYLESTLGWKRDKEYTYIDIIKDNIIKVRNVITGQSLYLKIFDNGEIIINRDILKTRELLREEISLDYNTQYYSEDICAAHYKIKVSKDKRVLFAIGYDKETILKCTKEEIDEERIISLDYFNNLSPVSIETSDKSLDILFNHCLKYQVVSSRINGKCGFYQAGGAIGFRDQLQDSLALIDSNPEWVREHILNSASHQYKEGDVMHWWHYDKFGVRTRIKDDSLFLVYVTIEYIKATGDERILDERVPYVESDTLKADEVSRLENPIITEEKQTLLTHLMRSIDNVAKFGEHNLVLIGGGDWNDALDNVGLAGKGESVWLSQFLYMCIKMIMPYIKDKKIRIKYINYVEKLYEAVNNYGYDGKWFRRVYTDKGEWLGSKESRVCKIDLLCQSFAVLSNIGDDEKIVHAIESAKSLIDYNGGLIKLLDPSFDDKIWYGYISAYPRGIRENGGQYTHATIWYLIALIRIGQVDEAYALFKMINPVNKLRDKDNILMYKGEPYAMPADIYSHIKHNGRMGWNFYTGSAAWTYKLILEEFVGVKLENNNLVLRPNLPEELNYINVDYRYKSSVYKIKIRKGDKNSMQVDKVEIVNGNTILLKDNGKVINIDVIIKNNK